jgi:hypothetical protein
LPGSWSPTAAASAGSDPVPDRPGADPDRGEEPAGEAAGGRLHQAVGGGQRHLRGLQPGDDGRADRRGTGPRGAGRPRANPDAGQDPSVTGGLTGHFHDRHAFLLDRMLARIDGIDADIAALDTQIEAPPTPFAAEAARLDEIPGIGPVAAVVLIAAIGVDMTRFPPLGEVLLGRQDLGRQEQGQRVHRARKPLPGPDPGRGRGHRRAHRHLPRRALPQDPQTPRQEARRRPWSRSAAPSWSSSGTSSPTPTPDSTTSAPTTSTETSAPTPSNPHPPTRDPPLPGPLRTCGVRTPGVDSPLRCAPSGDCRLTGHRHSRD